MKNNKGVTLIVLVVTIVVLIIIAGITLSVTLGNRSIIDTAKNTANEIKNEASDSQRQMDEFYNTIVERTTYE